MKLSHILFPHKKTIAQLNIQLVEKDITIGRLELDLSQMKEKSFNEAKNHIDNIESGNAALKAKILELEKQIENFKIGAKELQHDLMESKDKFETMKLENTIIMDEHKIQIQDLQNKLAKATDGNSLIAKEPIPVSDDETVKELRRRLGNQKNLIENLTFEINKLKFKK